MSDVHSTTHIKLLGQTEAKETVKLKSCDDSLSASPKNFIPTPKYNVVHLIKKNIQRRSSPLSNEQKRTVARSKIIYDLQTVFNIIQHMPKYAEWTFEEWRLTASPFRMILFETMNGANGDMFNDGVRPDYLVAAETMALVDDEIYRLSSRLNQSKIRRRAVEKVIKNVRRPITFQENVLHVFIELWPTYYADRDFGSLLKLATQLYFDNGIYWQKRATPFSLVEVWTAFRQQLKYSRIQKVKALERLGTFRNYCIFHDDVPRAEGNVYGWSFTSQSDNGNDTSIESISTSRSCTPESCVNNDQIPLRRRRKRNSLSMSPPRGPIFYRKGEKEIPDEQESDEEPAASHSDTLSHSSSPPCAPLFYRKGVDFEEENDYDVSTESSDSVDESITSMMNESPRNESHHLEAVKEVMMNEGKIMKKNEKDMIEDERILTVDSALSILLKSKSDWDNDQHKLIKQHEDTTEYVNQRHMGTIQQPPVINLPKGNENEQQEGPSRTEFPLSTQAILSRIDNLIAMSANASSAVASLDTCAPCTLADALCGLQNDSKQARLETSMSGLLSEKYCLKETDANVRTAVVRPIEEKGQLEYMPLERAPPLLQEFELESMEVESDIIEDLMVRAVQSARFYYKHLIEMDETERSQSFLPFYQVDVTSFPAFPKTEFDDKTKTLADKERMIKKYKDSIKKKIEFLQTLQSSDCATAPLDVHGGALRFAYRGINVKINMDNLKRLRVGNAQSEAVTEKQMGKIYSILAGVDRKLLRNEMKRKIREDQVAQRDSNRWRKEKFHDRCTKEDIEKIKSLIYKMEKDAVERANRLGCTVEELKEDVDMSLVQRDGYLPTIQDFMDWRRGLLYKDTYIPWGRYEDQVKYVYNRNYSKVYNIVRSLTPDGWGWGGRTMDEFFRNPNFENLSLIIDSPLSAIFPPVIGEWSNDRMEFLKAHASSSKLIGYKGKMSLLEKSQRKTKWRSKRKKEKNAKRAKEKEILKAVTGVGQERPCSSMQDENVHDKKPLNGEYTRQNVDKEERREIEKNRQIETTDDEEKKTVIRGDGLEGEIPYVEGLKSDGIFNSKMSFLAWKRKLMGRAQFIDWSGSSPLEKQIYQLNLDHFASSRSSSSTLCSLKSTTRTPVRESTRKKKPKLFEEYDMS